MGGLLIIYKLILEGNITGKLKIEGIPTSWRTLCKKIQVPYLALCNKNVCDWFRRGETEIRWGVGHPLNSKWSVAIAIRLISCLHRTKYKEHHCLVIYEVQLREQNKINFKVNDSSGNV